MSVQKEIDSFEKKLESVIKNAFGKFIRDDDDFEISADYDTHIRIEDVVKGLGLAVYGMSVAPSEFTITFEFTGPYEQIESTKKPQFCRISLDNDGDYFLILGEDDLKKSWHCGITDLNFNTKIISEEDVFGAMKEMNEVLLMSVLSN
jgi:hypothetical protein